MSPEDVDVETADPLGELLDKGGLAKYVALVDENANLISRLRTAEEGWAERDHERFLMEERAEVAEAELVEDAFRRFESGSGDNICDDARTALANLRARLRTAEAQAVVNEQQMQSTLAKNDTLRTENAVLIEGAANVGMERDMANADRDMLEADTIGILAHERIVESLRTENERLRSALKGETELSG